LANAATRVAKEAEASDGETSGTLADDLIAYIDAPAPGQPGAPEDMIDEDDDEA
jgi:hypothetical protein